MNRRREDRFASDRPATLTILRWGDLECAGRTVDFSGRGMQILVSNPITPGEAVAIHVAGEVLPAVVARCERKPEGYAVGVALVHSLRPERLEESIGWFALDEQVVWIAH